MAGFVNVVAVLRNESLHDWGLAEYFGLSGLTATGVGLLQLYNVTMLVAFWLFSVRTLQCFCGGVYQFVRLVLIAQCDFEAFFYIKIRQLR